MAARILMGHFWKRHMSAIWPLKHLNPVGSSYFALNKSLDERVYYCVPIPVQLTIEPGYRLTGQGLIAVLLWLIKMGFPGYASPLSLPALGYHHVILVMGDDSLARFIRTALPGYRSEPHYPLFALKERLRLFFTLQVQADADLGPRARYASSGAATNWAHTSRNLEDVSPVTRHSSDGGA
ncbi:hypothetical protein TRIATDRAFT_85933 [Trichoderma atroviride IMI 206040]|uniref:Uncharacterized protein n=1 Tax=Hypocrea atroviridis (strain ATCC 20476 / IMI 206040) TaxID=452589 RepID=G9P0Z9_HYPAI|nr:uncharacterized protein TRIATDRAFT_85933 [Trichoderma atroviride IMI 206040]EHK43246.1 hypothetical protein TRIATDRAFT_85933 [Trichoderma atroviride IMI 206040]